MRDRLLLIAFLALCCVYLAPRKRPLNNEDDCDIIEDAIGFHYIEDPDPDIDHNYQKVGKE